MATNTNSVEANHGPTSEMNKMFDGLQVHPCALEFVPKAIPDQEKLTERNTYHVPESLLLIVGKYVPDPPAPGLQKSIDTAATAYGSSKPKRTSVSAKSRTSGSSGTPPPVSDPSDTESEKDRTETAAKQKEHSARAAASSFSLSLPCSATGNRIIKPSDMVTYRMVLSHFGPPITAATLFFPVAYSVRPSTKEKSDPRGLPQEINNAYYPPYAPATKPLAVRALNSNKICMYKIGPGAVAFKVVISAFEASGMVYTPGNDWNVMWAKRVDSELLGSMNPYQKVNHFPGTWGIGRKDNLHKNMSKMRRVFGEAFDITPKTWVIPNEYKDLCDDAVLPQIGEVDLGPPVYIVKPVASSCGKGIHLSLGVPPLPVPPQKSLLVQRYVMRPYLIDGRKFDFRMYCVVTSIDPLRIYLFDEGLVRFAAEEYSDPRTSADCTYVHLTNYAINKTHAEEAAHEDIKWTITDFKHHLSRQNPQGAAALMERIFTQAKDVVIKTVLSIQAEVAGQCRSVCADPTGRGSFELFGLDLMVDADLRVYIIEVNIMPSLATGANLDKAVKSRMLAHLLTLVGVVPYCRSEVAPVPHSRSSRPSTASTPSRSHASSPQPPLSPPADLIDSPDQLTAEEKVMLAESEEELHRCGGFQRIFPTAETYSAYSKYFLDGFSRNNLVLASWEAWRLKEKGVRVQGPPETAASPQSERCTL